MISTIEHNRAQIKPAKLPVQFDNIPDEMKAHERWVVWDWWYSEKQKKWTKPPLQSNGQRASSTDPSTWATYGLAFIVGRSRSGVGFVLGKDVGYVGIDLDNCRDPETGKISEPAASIIRDLDTYAEVSPSGRGVKLLCKAALPDKCRKANHDLGIEAYGDGRYFTITGNVLSGNRRTIEERQAAVDQLVERWLQSEAIEHETPNTKSEADEIDLARSALQAISKCDGYWDWLRVGMSLKAISDTLLDDWDQWSRQSPKYSTGACAEKWNSFSGSGFGPGTLYHLAKQEGWKPPRGWKRKAKSDPAAAKDDARTEIVVSDNESTMVHQAIAALKNDPSVFVRFDRLVEVYRAPNPADPAKLTTIAMRLIPPEKLRTKISAHCCFVRDDEERAVTKIPSHLPGQVFHNAVYPELRPLTGVTEWPFLRPDGSICAENGYDRATQTILQCSVDVPPVKESPTREDAWEATESLLKIVPDFEFDQLKHKAAWLSGLLTVPARPAIAGPTPLVLVDANIWGAGKTKLVSLIALIFSGRPMPVTSWPSKDEEVDKRLTSFIWEGRPWVLWDNAKTTIAGQAIEAALTSQVYRGRRLGKTESIELPCNIIQFVTGNNASVSDDIARRTCHIRIVSASENPDSRAGFAITDLDEHVLANRATYIHNALTILRAWQLARRRGEKVDTEPWGSFEAWARVVRDALCWLGFPDVRSTSTDLKIDTSSGDSFRELLQALEDAEMPPEGWTSREILKAATQTVSGFDKPRNELLNAVLHEVIGDKRSFTALQIGKSLKKYDGRIFENKKFRTEYDRAKKINLWRILPVT